MTPNSAIVFAGQGAQAVGMGRDFSEAYPECRQMFMRANEILGFDIARICFDGPIEELTKSNYCQPAIFLVSACGHAMFRAAVCDVIPAGCAGLSLGEWSALYAADVLTFDDTLRVLEARGRFMQEACQEQPGGMVSVIGLPLQDLSNICVAAGVEIANLNSADQTVLSGPKEAIIEAEKLAKAAGAKKTIVLNVAGAFHSKLMLSAAVKLEKLLATVTFKPPRFPVISNVTGQPHGTPDQIRAMVVKQVTSSVHWSASVEWFKAAGVTRYVECGPGRILSGLIRRIDPAAATFPAGDVAALTAAITALK